MVKTIPKKTDQGREYVEIEITEDAGGMAKIFLFPDHLRNGLEGVIADMQSALDKGQPYNVPAPPLTYISVEGDVLREIIQDLQAYSARP